MQNIIAFSFEKIFRLLKYFQNLFKFFKKFKTIYIQGIYLILKEEKL